MTVFFRNSQPFTIIGLAFVHFLLWIPNIWEPVVADYSYQPFFWKELLFTLESKTYGPALLAFFGSVCTFLGAVYFNFLCRKFELLNKNTWVPGFMFSLISASIPQLNTFYPVQISLLILLYLIQKVFYLYKAEFANRAIYETGILAGCLSVFQTDFVILFFVLPFFLGILRVIDIRELLLLFVGFFTPIYFIGSLFFLTNYFPFYWQSEGWHLLTQFRPALSNENLLLMSLFAVFVLVYFLGLIRASMQRNRLTLRTRKFYFLIHFLSFILLIVFFISGPIADESALFLTIPLALYGTLFFLDQDLYLPKEITLMSLYMSCLILRFYHHFFDIFSLFT